jgi:hypothetical protein
VREGPIMARRLLLLGVCFTVLAGRAVADDAADRWLTDLDRAEQESRKTGKPLFVVFRCEH